MFVHTPTYPQKSCLKCFYWVY